MKQTSPMLYLVFPVTCDDEYCDSRPHVALIAVTAADIEGLLDDIRRVRNLKRGRWQGICNVDVFDYSADWAASLDVNRIAWPVRDLLRGKDFQDADAIFDLVILTARPLPVVEGDNSCHTDCDHRAIYDDRIHWAAYLKHTNTKIATESVRLGDLTRAARVFRRLARRDGR